MMLDGLHPTAPTRSIPVNMAHNMAHEERAECMANSPAITVPSRGYMPERSTLQPALVAPVTARHT